MPASARGVSEREAAALQPRDPDREGEPEDDEDRLHGIRGLRDRLVRTGDRLEPRQVQSTGSGNSAVVQKVTWTGEVTPTGEDFAAPVPGTAREERHLHVRRAARRTPTVRSSTGTSPSRERTRRRSRRRARSAAGAHRYHPRRARPRRNRDPARRDRARQLVAEGDVRSHEAAVVGSRSRRGRCATAACSGIGARVPDRSPCRLRASSSRARHRPSSSRTTRQWSSRFALISVTNVNAHSVTAGTVTRSPANPDTLVMPLKKVPRGWYLVLLARDLGRRASSPGRVHVLAVGPNPGPPPQFVVRRIASPTIYSTPASSSHAGSRS